MMPKLDEKNKRLLEFIHPNKKDRILVIGTGVFPKIEFFLFHNYKCRNIISGDISKKNIKNAKEILPELKFIFLDAERKFPFKDKSFDKVIMTEVLEHLTKEDKVLEEIRRVLKSKGKLILSVPKKRWFNFFSPVSWIQHKREYSEKSIKKVLKKSRFKIKKIFVGGNIWELINLWVHLIFKYFFRKLHVDSFFPKKIGSAYKKNFKGKGTDIIVQAEKN